MSKFRIGIATVATIAAGYGAWIFLSRPVDMPRSAEKTVSWEKMPDGSFVAQSGVEGFSDGLTRCWSIKDGYECVHAAQMSRTIDISAGEVRTLPNDGNISGIGFEGDKLIVPDAYRCSSTGIGNPEETIVGRGNRLASTSQGWSKAYVTKYLADNGINAKWFNCVGLAKILEGGSYATLGTTSVSRTMVFD